MVSDTRSSRKNKDESDAHSSRKKVNLGKDSSVCSPRKADKTSKSREMTLSPQSTRKSKRLDKGIPPLTPPVNRKSERLEKYNTPSPLRRSDRGKKDLSSGSSGSKQSAKESSPSVLKRKKEKTLIQVTMESKKAELDHEAVGMKRKKLNAQAFKALFKKQRIQEIVPDVGEELERSEKLVDVCSDNRQGIGSDQMGVAGKLRDEGIDKASDGAIQESISTLKSHPADAENDSHVDSSLRDYAVDEPCSKHSQTSSSVKNMSENPERLPTNCSATENMDASESESSTSSARSPDGSASLGSNGRCMHPKVAEATTSLSSKCENCNLLGTCVVCSKNKRVDYDSPERELCSCSPTDSDLGAAAISDSQMDGHENVCALCNKDGELLSCVGKSCRRCYHLSCVDPPLTDALPGVWHCSQCVKKKVLFGVHSVSEGVESIWDVREVEVSNAKGARQKQYLVKYHGLAHLHNHWVPEKQLLLENPCLLSNFVEQDQIVRYSAEWMLPHRLLRKKPIQDKIYIASSTVILVCEYEWLVKWRGLDYNHATWELDNSNFLSSSLGQNLMKDYEIRRQKPKQKINEPYTEPILKLPEFLASRSRVNENYLLKNVNKLRECLFQSLNAVVIDDQERAMTISFFIQSVSENCQPFLIVTTSGSLSQWEAEFALVPSVDVVVYSGSTDTRKGIRASEFHDEEGCLMVQVLLSSVEALSEDIEILKSINWKAIVIDEFQHSGISNALEQIKMLSTDLKILLVSGQIKDTTSEYLKMLSLLESRGDFDKLRGLKPETNDNLCKLKDRLSRFIAYGRSSQVSKFIEYWVPVWISNCQLEQYCATLLSNSIPLCSCSRSDPVGALRDTLLMVRKCCIHPYLLDPSMQERLFHEQCPAAELLDIGIKASGKLQLLDMMLTEIKTRGLQVLILFELIIVSGKISTGDILDDFLQQRFGQNTYERVDAGLTPSKKQAAVNRFNKKETGQFVFLLDNRACSSMIKLSSLDVVVIYDSDWNPANDLRVLQKISIDSKVDQIKVFRLYSSFTIEEKALVLAKQNLNLDNNLQNFSRSTSNTLLSWGATYLFSKLEEYHSDNNSNSAFIFSSEQLLLDEVTKELQAILSDNYENTDPNAVISEVKLGVGSYRANIPMLGEAKVQLKDGEEPHVFWKNLLDGKRPIWKHLTGPSPRTRKRVHYWEGSPSKSEIGKDDIVKKRKKMVNEILDPALVQVESGVHQMTSVAVSKEGPSTIKASNQSENSQRGGQSSLGAEVSASAASEERIVSSDEQKSFHSVLQGEMSKLCQTLKLSEDVTHIVRKFLEYVIKNHHVNSDSTSIVQAFQISLCWAAASITKQKVDKKGTLMLAKQLLNYQCTEEQANSVYSKMRSLKRMYLQSSDKFTDLDRDCLLAESRELLNVNGGGSDFSSYKQKNVKLEVEEKYANEEHAEGRILVQQNLALKDKTAAGEIDNKIKKIQRKCDKRMKKLILKHQQEIQEFQKIWKQKREDLERDHKLESAVIRSIRGQSSVGLDKLKLLESNFAKKMEEHNLLKDAQLKDLEARQSAAIDEERLKAADWLAKVKACSNELSAINGQQSLNVQSEDDAEWPWPSTRVSTMGNGDAFLLSRQHVESENAQGNDVRPSTSSISAPAEARGCGNPVENFVTTNSQNEAGVTSMSFVKLLNPEMLSSANGETVSANLPAPLEQVSDDIRSVGLSEELSVPNEMEGQVHPGELSNASDRESDKAREIASSDDLVSQRAGPEEAASGGLHSTGQPVLLSEQTVASADCCDSLPQQVQQDEIARSLGSSELQDSDAAAVENRSTSQIEIPTSEPIDSVAPAPSDLELTRTDEIENPLPSSHEDPVNENPEQLHSSSVDASVSCNQSPATESHEQGRSSSQTAEPVGREVLSHESTSHGQKNLEIHPNQPDRGCAADATHEQSVESSAVSQNHAAVPQVVVSASERSNQAALQLDIDASSLCRPSYLERQTHQPTAWNSTPSLSGDPLQNELERIRKETEQLEKTQEDMMSQLKSDCEKEIEEIISQIRNKYEVKLQESEAEFRSKRNELDKSQNKLLLNKVLAEAFRSKCLDVRSSGLPAVQQGVAPNFMQQLHQFPLPPSIRHSPGPSGCQPARSQLITTPAVQAMQQLPQPHSSRSSPVAVPSVAAQPVQGVQCAAPPPTVTAAQPVQGVQHAASPLSGTSPRPPVISAISPAGNIHGGGGGGGGEIRSIAPHLQPFRPAAAASVAPAMSPSVSQLRPVQVLPSQPVQLPPQPGPLPRAPQQPSRNLVTQDMSVLQGGIPAPPNPSPMTQGFVVGLNHRPSVPGRRTSSSLPDISSTFSSLELSDLEMLDSSVQGNQTSVVASDVVCLSDDD